MQGFRFSQRFWYYNDWWFISQHTGDTPKGMNFSDLMLYLTDTYQQEIHVSTFNVDATMKFD